MALAFPPPQEYRANLLGMMAYVARYGRVTPAESGEWPITELIEFQEAIAGFVSQENEVQERD